MKESQDSLHTAKHVRFVIDDVYRDCIALSVYSRSFVATRHLNREENERQRQRERKRLKENVYFVFTCPPMQFHIQFEANQSLVCVHVFDFMSIGRLHDARDFMLDFDSLLIFHRFIFCSFTISMMSNITIRYGFVLWQRHTHTCCLRTAMAGVNEHITTSETGVDESELLTCLLCERQTIAALKSQHHSSDQSLRLE